MARVLVLGAGPAGLAAAWRAAAADHDVTVLDAREHVGGMAASLTVAGQRVDLGSHRLHPSIDPAVLADLRGLLGGDLQRRPRRGRIRLADRWLAFPLRPGDLVRSLPPALSARAALDAVMSPLRSAHDDSFASVVSAGLGPTVASAFYEPYARKLWDADWRDLDGELARRRVGTRSVGAVLRRLAAGRRGRGDGQDFLYPRLGFGQIAEALASAARDAGVDLRLGGAVREVAVGGHATPAGSTPRRPCGVRVTTEAGAGVDADVVLSTIPLRALVRAVVPSAPEDVVTGVASLRMRAMVLLYLVVDAPSYTGFDAHYLPGPETIVSRLSEPKNYRDGPDPAGATVLCCEIPCWEGDEVWSASPGELGARVAAELVSLGLPDPSPASVERIGLPSVYPVYDRGFGARLEAVERWLSTMPGVVTFGRQGLFVPDNTHHALAMGYAAAAALRADGTIDRPRWTAARDAFRTHVVED